MKVRLVEDERILREYESINDGDIDRYTYTYKPVKRYRIEVEKDEYGVFGQVKYTYWSQLWASNNKEEMEEIFNWVKENKSLTREDVLDTCEINE